MPDSAPESLTLCDIRPEHVETHRLLQELLLEVRALPAAIVAALAERESASNDAMPFLPAPDLAKLSSLYPLIAVEFADSVFTTGDVFQRGERKAELRNALIPCDGANRTGRLLSRAVGQNIGGYRIEVVGEDRCGVVWRLVTAGSRLDR